MSFKWRDFFMEQLCLIVLIVIPAVWSGDWKVYAQDQCALQGTSVVIPCSYYYPYWHEIETVQWVKQQWNIRYGYFSDSRKKTNFEYVGDKYHNCTAKIKNVKRADEGIYRFRFTTDKDGWNSQIISLSVRGLIASVEPTVVKEGEIVTLTCRSECTNTNIQSVWFREGQPFTHTRFTAMRENAGSYVCALQEQNNVQSTSVSLSVQYAPKNVRLTISPSEDIEQGRAVSFTCSSEAKPTVAPNGYSLFKEGNLISSGSSHRISEVQPSDSGQYYCQARNNITWNGSNLFQSTKTRVNVLYPPMNISISAKSTEVVEGSNLNLTCLSNANPPAVGYTWYRTSSSSIVQVGSGPVLSLSPVEVSSSGLYMCQASNRLGKNNSTELLLSVKTQNSAVFFPILAGTGGLLVIAFTFALLLYCKKQRKNQDKTTEFSKRDSSSAAKEMQDHIYDNVLMIQAPSFKHRTDYTSSEEVFYTTVSIKHKKRRRKSHVPTAPEMEDSVIYAEVVKSS